MVDVFSDPDKLLYKGPIHRIMQVNNSDYNVLTYVWMDGRAGLTNPGAGNIVSPRVGEFVLKGYLRGGKSFCSNKPVNNNNIFRILYFSD